VRLVPYVAAASVLVLGPGAAPADNGDSASVTRVRVALAGATAKIHVTLVIDHDGGGEETHALTLPPRAVITGATFRTGHTTRTMALTDAETVDIHLGELESAPRADSSARAIAIMSDGFFTNVQTLAPGRMAVVLDLDLEAATCFVGDRRHLKIPADWVDKLEAGKGRVLDNQPADKDSLDTESTPIDAACADGTEWSGDEQTLRWLALPTTELSGQPVGDRRFGTRAGRFAHKSIEAARVELSLSSTISAVPDDLATVFLVDGSRSVDSEELVAQGEVIASYARLAPTTKVQVIAFDREAHPLLPKLTRASTAAPTIARELGKLVPRNGSDLDRGLAAAGTWLASHTGTRRIVLFTDELLPDRLSVLDPATLATLVPGDTVVHVVAIGSGAGSLDRDDEVVLAPLADATKGMPVRAYGGTDTTIDALALVRPISLDHVRVIAPTTDPLNSTAVAGTPCVVPGDADRVLDLHEGDACTWWATGPSTVDSIAIEGLLWGAKWRRVIPLGEPDSVDVAREAWSVLDRDAMPGLTAAADAAARAVNRKWSLFATWGGTGGYDELSGGSMDGFGCGCGDSADIGHGIAGYGTVAMTGPSVEDQVGKAIAACHKAGDGAVIGIDVETTRDEIVGVTTAITGVTGTAATTMQRCVDTAVWDLGLWISQPSEHRHYSLRY